MLSNLFCVRLYYACYLCCLGLALSAIIFILFRDSVCFNTHWDHGPLLMKEKKKANKKQKENKKPLHSSMCWQMQSIKQCFMCACVSAWSVASAIKPGRSSGGRGCCLRAAAPVLHVNVRETERPGCWGEGDQLNRVPCGQFITKMVSRSNCGAWGWRWNVKSTVGLLVGVGRRKRKLPFNSRALVFRS